MENNEVIIEKNEINAELISTYVNIKYFYIKFKIKDLVMKEKFMISDINQTYIKHFSYSISEKYKIPYRRILSIVNEQIDFYIKKYNLNALFQNDQKDNVNDIYKNNENKEIQQETFKLNNEMQKDIIIENNKQGLYYKSIIEIEKKKKKSEEYKNKNIENELKETKIRPKKTEYSTLLNLKQEYKNEKNKNIKKEVQSNDKFISNDDFHILDKEIQNEQENKRICKSPEEISIICDRLHNYYKINSLKKEKLSNDYYNQICSFKPIINSELIIKSADKHDEINDEESVKDAVNNNHTKKDFISRSYQWNAKLNELKEEKRKISTKVDLTTGEVLFNPIAYRGESINIVMDKIKNNEKYKENIHERLYKENVEIKTKRSEELKKHEEDKKLKVKNSIFKGKKLEIDVAEDQKHLIFEQLYKLINPNNLEEFILTNEYIKDLCIDNKTILKLGEFINCLKQDESFDKDRFIQKSEEIYDTLSIEHQNKIKNWYTFFTRVYSPKKIREEKAIEANQNKFTFQPTISNTSNEIFSQSGNKYTGTTFMNRNIDLIKKKSSYIEEEANKKIINELDECTFKPNTDKSQYNSPIKKIKKSIIEENFQEDLGDNAEYLKTNE